MYKILFSLSFFLILGACSFKQEAKFNKDFSGTISATLDLSQLRSMGGDDPEVSNSIIDPEMQERLDKLKTVKGISKLKYEETADGVGTISYDFDGIKSLNESSFLFYQGSNAETHTFFVQNSKKSLTFKFPDMSSEDPEEMGDMGSMFTYDLKFLFPKAVKSIKTKGEAKLSSDKKSVEINTDLGKLSAPGYQSEVEILF
jgi:hypothetical protein